MSPAKNGWAGARPLTGSPAPGRPGAKPIAPWTKTSPGVIPVVPTTRSKLRGVASRVPMSHNTRTGLVAAAAQNAGRPAALAPVGRSKIATTPVAVSMSPFSTTT